MPIFGGARQTFLCSDMKADRGKIWGKEVGKILKNKSSFRTKKTQNKTKKRIQSRRAERKSRAGYTVRLLSKGGCPSKSHFPSHLYFLQCGVDIPSSRGSIYFLAPSTWAELSKCLN